MSDVVDVVNVVDVLAVVGVVNDVDVFSPLSPLPPTPRTGSGWQARCLPGCVCGPKWEPRRSWGAPTVVVVSVLSLRAGALTPCGPILRPHWSA